jgi:endonuclease/exonuclease/phosphatase family metal-dependent hydrolase
MKHISTLLAILAFVTFYSCAPRQVQTRLLCYNVHNCVGLDGELSVERIARIINEADVEAVAIQELDSMTTRYPGHDMLSEVAALTDMYPTYAPTIDYRGGKYGIGMLTREKPLSYRQVPLPCRSEPRALLIVELEDYYYCCTHLSLHEEDRVKSISIIVNELSQLDKPAIIAGDFNALPNSMPMQFLARQFQVFPKSGVSFTFPANKPTREIDYIALYSGGGATANVLYHEVLSAPVESDHAPIVARVEITK